MKEITLDFVQKQCEAFLKDPQAIAAANNVCKHGALAAAINVETQKTLPFVFEVEVWNGGTTDQGSTGRCWTFASLNVVRHNMQRSLQIAEKGFELSQNYIYFFDLLEKCSRFLDQMIQLIETPLDDPKVANALRRPIADNGMWYVFCDLADKYGVVPKYMMPDTQCSADSKYVTRILEQKLKLSTKQLRDAYADGCGTQGLYDLKEALLSGVFSILTRFLGVPPRTVQFEYRRTDGTFIKLDEMTPQEFYRRYGNMNSADYCFIMNLPDAKYPFGRVYAEDPASCRPVDRRFNLDMEHIKQLVAASLRGGDQVIMGCDVAKQSDKASGYMSQSLLDYEHIFGTDLEFPDRASWWSYKGHSGGTSGLHIMTFDGVHFAPNGSPSRWRVQNSYGPSMGNQGHYVMDNSWFDRYVSSVVIHRKYISQELLDIFDGPADQLAPGALF